MLSNLTHCITPKKCCNFNGLITRLLSNIFGIVLALYSSMRNETVIYDCISLLNLSIEKIAKKIKYLDSTPAEILDYALYQAGVALAEAEDLRLNGLTKEGLSYQDWLDDHQAHVELAERLSKLS